MEAWRFVACARGACFLDYLDVSMNEGAFGRVFVKSCTLIEIKRYDFC